MKIISCNHLQYNNLITAYSANFWQYLSNAINEIPLNIENPIPATDPVSAIRMLRTARSKKVFDAPTSKNFAP